MKEVMRIISKALWLACLLLTAGAVSVAVCIVIMYVTYSVLIAI